MSPRHLCEEHGPGPWCVLGPSRRPVGWSQEAGGSVGLRPSQWAAPRSRKCRGDMACVLFVSKLSAIREHSSDNGNYLVEKRDPTPWEREV